MLLSVIFCCGKYKTSAGHTPRYTMTKAPGQLPGVGVATSASPYQEDRRLYGGALGSQIGDHFKIDLESSNAVATGQLHYKR